MKSDILENLIGTAKLGDWDTSAYIATKILTQTNAESRNELFGSLLRYYNCPNVD